MSWQGKVYQKRKRSVFNMLKWEVMRNRVYNRDKHTCYSCKKTYMEEVLTAHHIIPREKGGKNIMSNLITLCSTCHDVIEPLNLSRRQIKNYLKDHKEPFSYKPNYGGKDWKKWVYGGYRREDFK